MNSTSRYYLPAEQWSPGTLTLTGDEAHHCTRVLRSKLGDSIELFDGLGRAVCGEIIELSKEKVVIQPHTEPHTTAKAKPIYLYQAIPKGGNMELIVQKAVELGVSSIQPLITDHTIINATKADQLKKKQLKWQRIALEACKQCGQNYLPTIHPPLQYSEWIQNLAAEESQLKIIAALLPNSLPLNQVFSAKPESASLLVGPEGDFSDAEYKLALSAGFQPTSLGDIVLRVETATLYCLSVIKHEMSR